ncbi:MAG TPA: class D sortase [Thermoanaerobaculia bacterium]|jgi:sortase A|nr:class D sortase [Thermoanaerobaculia bacterium]
MDSTTIRSHRNLLLWLERGLMLVAALCLGVWIYTWIDAAWVQHRDNQLLDDALNQAPATAQEPASGAAESDALGAFTPAPDAAPEPPKAMLEAGSLVGRIEIPRIGVSAVVLEGADDTTLRRGVGHIPETSMPGTGLGNVGLAAHRDSFFRGLKDIRKNDIIRVQTLDGTFRYRVEWTQIVMPEDTQVLSGNGVPELTLVTCYPFYYIGSAPKRFIVRAREIAG